MPQQEHVPKGYSVQMPTSYANASGITLQSTGSAQPATFRFEAIKPGIFRTSFTSPNHPLPPYPSAPRIRPDGSRASLTSVSNTAAQIQCGGIIASLEWSSVPILSIGYAHEDPLHNDLPHRSYAFDAQGCAHYSSYHRGSLHIGLGEKAAPMDLSNRSFTLSATDSFGYDVHRTDPLYKHIPLLIRATPQGCVATFSSSHSRGFCSVGGEMDGMWGRYKIYRQDFGGLEEYTLIGRTLQEIVKLYADLVGYPLLAPRWAFGYIGGGYKYTMLDEPRACDALMEFAAKLEEHDIPCSGFQMSSGYTIAEHEPKTRDVFHWNRHRFPDPAAFVQAYRRKGIRLIANIKPYVLASHPEYKQLEDAGALFKDPSTGASAIARLWSAGGGTSGEGGHIDFSSQEGFEFWFNGVKAMRELGIDCPWNDNNEYVVGDDTWELKLNGQAVQTALANLSSESPATCARKDIGLWGRFMHTELMGMASNAALTSAAPHERPFVLTRSATPGTMRYCASSWSGDNVTSWDGMRGANAISLTAGACLLHCYGHDIGGFEGPQPSPELLLRWVQLGIHSPRFAINCFKTTEESNVGDVIEPWMYPEILPQIRQAVKRRYEIIPYLYHLHLQSHLHALPPQRWVGWGYEGDSEVWTNQLLKDGETQYWLGDTLMVGGVYEPGVSEAKVYLPKRNNSDLGFLNTNAPYQHLQAGQWHTVSSPWKQSIPILARIGGIVPVGRNGQTVAPGDRVNEANLPADDWRGVEIFPPPEEYSDGREYVNSWLEDDGISPAPAKVAALTVTYRANASEVSVKFDTDASAFQPPWLKNGLTVVLPAGDSRPVISADPNAVVEPRRPDDAGRRCFQILSQSHRAQSKL